MRNKKINSQDKIYLEFVSKISFLEFVQEEFREAEISIDSLKEEISILCNKKNWNVYELSNFIRKYPKSFIIFENLFQQLRFTNAQLIHFLFNVTILNSNNLNAIFEYMIFYIRHNIEMRKIFIKLIDPELSYEEFVLKIDTFDKSYLIAIFKVAISKYIVKISKNIKMLENHIVKKEFEDLSIRFANYLINNLKLNDIISYIDVEKFLKCKRVPLDIKNLHGKYAKIRVKKILENNGYINIDEYLDNNNVLIIDNNLEILKNFAKDKKIYCTERFVKGIVKPKDNKPKKFDLIIFKNNEPKYLFEINFYSTEGTKISINQNEYIDLNNYIKNNFPQYKFFWITDGNYWLTHQGKLRFINLLNYFEQILNINTFETILKDIIN